MEVLKIEGLEKTFQTKSVHVHALKGINVSIHKGEFVAIMGPSGSGKSTFLQIVGGLEAPTNGKLYLQGEELKNFYIEPYATKYRQEKLGFLFQFFNLLTSLTAEENIALPLLLKGFNKTQIKEKTEKMIQLVGLQERKDHKIHELSGGQQQRVAIARALIHEPPILLADEPTGNLDSRTSVDILHLLIQMKEMLQQTILLVTHDPMVATYADRVIFFQDGAVVKELKNEENQDRREKMFMIMDQMREITEGVVR